MRLQDQLSIVNNNNNNEHCPKCDGHHNPIAYCNVKKFTRKEIDMAVVKSNKLYWEAVSKLRMEIE